MNNEQLDPLRHVRSGAWLDKQVFPPMEWVVPGLFPEGYGLLVGPPKVGKSWFTYDLALNVARGGTILGAVDVPQRPVFLLAMEDGHRRLQERGRKLLNRERLPSALDVQVKRSPDVLTTTVPAWLDLHHDEKPLIIIDTLQTVRPPQSPGSNSYEYDYQVGEMMLNLIADHPGTGLIVIHHTRKQMGGDWMDATSGTQGVNGSAEYTAALLCERGSNEGVLHVTGRDVAGGSYAVTFNGGMWRIDGESLKDAATTAQYRTAVTGLGDLSAQIVTALSAANRPMNATEVMELVPGLDRPKADKYLSRLASDGRIHRTSRGIYAVHPEPQPTVRSVRSVRNEQEATSESDTPDTSDTPSRSEPTAEQLQAAGPDLFDELDGAA